MKFGSRGASGDSLTSLWQASRADAPSRSHTRSLPDDGTDVVVLEADADNRAAAVHGRGGVEIAAGEPGQRHDAKVEIPENDVDPVAATTLADDEPAVRDGVGVRKV